MGTLAWEDVWSQGNIMIEGDIQLAKITTFAQYYILSSLPTIEAYQPPQHSEFLYGVSRNSLAKGEIGKDYHGHIMWDNEVGVVCVWGGRAAIINHQSYYVMFKLRNDKANTRWS